MKWRVDWSAVGRGCVRRGKGSEAHGRGVYLEVQVLEGHGVLPQQVVGVPGYKGDAVEASEVLCAGPSCDLRRKGGREGLLITTFIITQLQLTPYYYNEHLLLLLLLLVLLL